MKKASEIITIAIDCAINWCPRAAERIDSTHRRRDFCARKTVKYEKDPISGGIIAADIYRTSTRRLQ